MAGPEVSASRRFNFRALLKRYAKELSIGLVFSVITAVAVEWWKDDQDHQRKEAIKNNEKAVAIVKTYTGKGEPAAQGSGVFLDGHGTLVTAYHVIKGANLALTRAQLSTGAYYDFKGVRFIDEQADIAILAFEAVDTPFVTFGDSDKLERGRAVRAIGARLGLGNPVSEGIISDPRRQIGTREFIQFAAAISSGSSGGGLFDAINGRALGIVSRSLSSADKGTVSQNLNLATPINIVKAGVVSPEPALTAGSAEYWYSEGVLAENRKQYSVAIQYFQKALALDDKYVDADIELGNIFYEQGAYDKQVKVLRHAVAVAPQNADAWYYLAQAYENMGQFDSAAAAYRKGLEIKPDDKDSMFQLGIIYIIRGSKDKARELATKLVDFNPGLGQELRVLSR